MASLKNYHGMKDAASLSAEYGWWDGDIEEYPVSDWIEAVANGDTRLGYWAWVEVQIEVMG